MLNVLPYHVIFGAAELADGLELLIELDFLLKIVINIITYWWNNCKGNDCQEAILRGEICDRWLISNYVL